MSTITNDLSDASAVCEAALTEIMRDQKCDRAQAHGIFVQTRPLEAAPCKTPANNDLLAARALCGSSLTSASPQNAAPRSVFSSTLQAIRSFFAKILDAVWSIFRRPIKTRQDLDSTTVERATEGSGARSAEEVAAAANVKDMVRSEEQNIAESPQAAESASPVRETESAAAANASSLEAQQASKRRRRAAFAQLHRAGKL